MIDVKRDTESEERELNDGGLVKEKHRLDKKDKMVDIQAEESLLSKDTEEDTEKQISTK